MSAGRRRGGIDALRPLAEALGGAVPAAALEAAPAAAIARRWPAVVGELVARESWPARVTADGTLIVHCRSSVWASELNHLGAALGAALEREGVVPAPPLRFVVGPVPRRSEPAPEVQLPPPDPVDAERAAAWAGTVRDPRLRAAVERAAEAALRARRSSS